MCAAPAVTLVYAFDPLCGWCYGFGPVMAELRREFGDGVGWEVALGGLFCGARRPRIGEMAGYLARGTALVEARTGVTFGAGFRALIAEGRWRMDSEPGCRAIRAVAALEGGATAVDFGHALCSAHFGEGLRPDDEGDLAEVARRCGVDPERLLAAWRAPDAVAATERAFADARRAGVSSYPALYRREGAALRGIVSGCVPLEVAREALRSEIE